MATLRIKKGSMILLPFPFSDQRGVKVRPALVVSNDTFNKGSDIVVCAVTSRVDDDEYTVVINPSQLSRGKLHVVSAVKVASILRVQKSRVHKVIATVGAKTMKTVQGKLDTLLRT